MHLDSLHLNKIRKKIAVYGGAFDPIHFSHIEVAKYLCQRRDIHEVMIVPSSVHPFQKQLKPFHLRKALIETAIQADPFLARSCIRVVDVEDEIAQVDSTFKGYTYQVLSYIRAKNPDSNISFCLGADNVEDMIAGKWDMSYELARDFSLIVAGRGGLPHTDYACYSWYDGGADFLDVSSTRIRKALKTGKDHQALFLCPKAVQERVKTLYSTES